MLLQSIKVLTLKMYGSNLLTPSANAWILLVRALILGMAITEALSWGYAGRILIPGSWPAAVLAGTVIFVFVWGVDASLMSLDRSERKAKTNLTAATSGKGVPSASSDDLGGSDASNVEYQANESSVWSKLRGKLFGGVIVRSGLVVASLVFTAPFIALIVFEKDIDAELDRSFSKRVADQTAELRARISTEQEARSKQGDELARQSEEANALLKERERELNDEMRNPETRGYGPIAKRLEEQVKAARIQQQRKQAEIEVHTKVISSRTPAETELVEFNSAISTKNYRLLNDRWTIAADPNSYQVRNKIIAETFESTPEFKRAERTIQAFLSFLFLGLAIMKIYEPRSTRIYFNAALQSNWLRFEAGAFDPHLRPDEKSKAAPCSMTPFRFEEFILDELPSILSRTTDQIADAKLRQDHADGQQAVAALVAEKAGEIARLDQIRAAVSETRVQLARIESRLKLGNTARDALLAELEELRTRERGLRDKIKGGVSEEFLDMASNMTEGLHTKRDSAQARLLDVETSLSQLESEQTTMTAKARELLEQERNLNSRLDEISRLQSLAAKVVAEDIRRKLRK